MLKSVAMLVLIVGCVASQAASIYQCRTKDGSMAFQSVPCDSPKVRKSTPVQRTVKAKAVPEAKRLDDNVILDFASLVHQSHEQKQLDQLSKLLSPTSQITWTGMDKKGRVTKQWTGDDYIRYLTDKYAQAEQLSLSLASQQVTVSSDGNSARYRVVVTKQSKNKGATRRSVMLEEYGIELIANESKIVSLKISPF